eukprot:scaffold134700_cov46-Cyclotella_meneghiniana.AAC.1
MNGMRVKLSFSFNAIGASSPLYITVTGLTDEEMPIEEDMLVVEVPGLCVGGGVGSNDQVGYVVFTKKNSGADQTRFEHYHKNDLKPMIDKYRERLYNYDSDSGAAIPRELFAVACSDGGLPQVKAVANDPDFFIENLITMMKQNAARTGVEQPADLAKVFKVIKLCTKTYTVSNIDPSDHPLKKLLWEAFHSGELTCLNLNDKKKRSLIDFIPSFADMAGKALTERNIRHGFIESGMIDQDKHKYPVLTKILGTCKTPITIELYNKFISNFTRLYKVMLENGHIPDEYYDELGFPKDKDVNGNDVLREAGISQESQQRSKILTHPEQSRLRKKRLDELKAKRQRIETEKREKEFLKIKDVIDIRDRLSNMLFQDNVMCLDTSDLQLCTFEHFHKLRAPELVKFILAHDPNFTTKSQLDGWRKGQSESDKEAQIQALHNETPNEELKCTTIVAFRCRHLPCKYDLTTQLEAEEEVNGNVDEPTPARANVAELSLQVANKFSSCDAWLFSVIEFFGVRRMVLNAYETIDDEMKAKADMLVKILRQRMQQLMNSRGVDKKRREHWVINTANKNLAVVAAYMVLLNHVKNDVSRLDETNSLLSLDTSKFVDCRSSLSMNSHIGAYLYYDTNIGEFIRSGKVSAKGFLDRHEEHAKAAAREASSDNKFYTLYPTKANPRSKSTLAKGVFESLTQYEAASFDMSNGCVNKDFADGGVMILSDADKVNIESS